MDRPLDTPPKLDSYYERTAELPSPKHTANFLQSIPAQGHILDFGAGSGLWSAAFLRDRPDVVIDALDQNLERAALLPENWRGEKIISLFQDFTPTKSYDGIWASQTFFFLKKEELSECFHKLASSLKENGTIAFTMVDDCHVARTKKYHGLSKEAIMEMVKREGLELTLLKRREDIQYDFDKLAIPTYFVVAKKPQL